MRCGPWLNRIRRPGDTRRGWTAAWTTSCAASSTGAMECQIPGPSPHPTRLRAYGVISRIRSPPWSSGSAAADGGDRTHGRHRTSPYPVLTRRWSVRIEWAGVQAGDGQAQHRRHEHGAKGLVPADASGQKPDEALGTIASSNTRSSDRPSAMTADRWAQRTPRRAQAFAQPEPAAPTDREAGRTW